MLYRRASQGSWEAIFLNLTKASSAFRLGLHFQMMMSQKASTLALTSTHNVSVVVAIIIVVIATAGFLM